MGFEDRQYYRDERSQGGVQGLRFSQQSVVLSLIIINVAIFLLDSFTPEVSADHTHWLSNFLSLSTNGFWQVWAYLTHGFCHASFNTEIGIWHIAGNMLTLWFLGRPVEHRIGRSEFLKFYLVALVVAGLGWMALRWILAPGQPAFIVGASGAVSAVVVVFIFMYPRQTVMLMGVVPIPAWALGVLMLVTNVLHSFNPVSHIAWEAHMIGALFGLLYFKQRWSFERINLGVPKLFGPKLRVHNPSNEDKLQLEADRVLEKISQSGEESLSSKERKILKKYSQRVRENRQDSSA